MLMKLMNAFNNALGNTIMKSEAGQQAQAGLITGDIAFLLIVMAD